MLILNLIKINNRTTEFRRWITQREINEQAKKG
jgi:hypothetical protein